MELGNAPGQRVWTYRKAAWAIEDLEIDIRLIYGQMGQKSLESIPGTGSFTAAKDSCTWLRSCSIGSPLA